MSGRAGTRATVGRIPRAAWICALVALLNGLAWSLVTPAFQLPDEPGHYAYVEKLARTGSPPPDHSNDPARIGYSPEVQRAQAHLKQHSVAGRPDNAGLWSQLERDRMLGDLRAGYSRDGDGYAYGVASQPVLFYALQTVPYTLAEGGTLLQRLALMRLLSVALGGLAVLLVHLFLREVLPSQPWAWTVGALGAAFQPLFGYMSGGVNPDVLLTATAAGLFLCLARMLRRGLTLALAVTTGLVIAIGVLGKLNFAGLLPGAVVAVLVVALRQERGLRALRLPAATALAAVMPALIGMALNVGVWGRDAISLTSGQGATAGSLGDRLTYLWQLYLPPLPGMTPLFEGTATPWNSWWVGWIGWLGWLDTRFAAWVYVAALAPAAAVLALAARELVRRRAALRARLPELAVYGLLAAGLLTLIAAQSYSIDVTFGGSASGAMARYLLPLLPLLALVLALAARGAGRRWGPAAGVLIVLGAFAHGVFSELLVAGRYYA